MFPITQIKLIPPRILYVMGPEKPGSFCVMGLSPRCHFLGSWLAQKEHKYDKGGRGRRQQRGTDHITQQKINYITQINSRANYITQLNSPEKKHFCM